MPSDLILTLLFFGVITLAPIGWFVWYGVTLARGSRSARRLPALAAALGLSMTRYVGRRSWLAVEEVIDAATGFVSGREIKIHYACYSVSVRRLEGAVRYSKPAVETWIETPIAPRLRLGVDDITDVLSMQRGWAPGQVLAGLGRWIKPRQRVAKNRREATSRMLNLLTDPQTDRIACELGPHILSASDERLLVVVPRHVSAPDAQRACAVAARIAMLLPQLRHSLPPTPLDAAVSTLESVSRAWIERHGSTDLSFSVGAHSGSYVTIDLDTGVDLIGLGSIIRGFGGVPTHWDGGRPAPMPVRLSTGHVQSAVRELGAVPEFSSIITEGTRIRVLAEPGAARSEDLVRASFALASALRAAGMGAGA